MGGRAFEVLLALAQRPGKVVTKAELLAVAWPGLVVEENNISVQIASLRKVLGAKCIATVAGRGYQLSAVPIVAGEAAAPPAISELLVETTTELLGRQQDSAEMLALLARARLVTIVGPGGVGKTALARDVFPRQCAQLQKPGHWIDLAPVRETRQFVGMVAKAFHIEIVDVAQHVDTLLLALGDASAIVVLDNCEHLAEQVSAFVRQALAAVPRIRWLATSQVPLRVLGESVYRLKPLDVPPDRLSTAHALEFGAIALLCKRVAEADRRFRLSDGNVDSAIALCAQLDGLPLAIEMAAARVATFGLEEVRQRLDQRLKLLTANPKEPSQRHGALQEMYDWSYGLLSECEQAVFRRLEPFLGGFRAAMAQQVACDDDSGGLCDPWQALDALGALVDKSLVQRSPDDTGRFHLLESAREYARERLDAAGETRAVHRRHAHAVASWFAHAQADADRMTDTQWLRHYMPERHNARVALRWACQDEAADDVAQLVTALTMMDWMLCRQAEILQLDVPTELLARAAPGPRASAYLELSWAHFSEGSHELGARMAQEAFEIFGERSETSLAYRALAQLTRLYESTPGMNAAADAAWARLQQFDSRQVPFRTRLFCAISAGLVLRPDFTVERMRELGRLAEDAGFEAIAAICNCNLTDKLLIARRHEETVAVADEWLRSANRLPRACAFIQHNKALALIRLGRFDEAYEPGQQAFQTMPAVASFLVDTFALAAVLEGRPADAAVLHGCGTRWREDRESGPDVAEADSIAETADRLKRTMTATELAELMALGSTMSPNEVLAIKVFPHAYRLAARVDWKAGPQDPSSSTGAA